MVVFANKSIVKMISLIWAVYYNVTYHIRMTTNESDDIIPLFSKYVYDCFVLRGVNVAIVDVMNLIIIIFVLLVVISQCIMTCLL